MNDTDYVQQDGEIGSLEIFYAVEFGGFDGKSSSSSVIIGGLGTGDYMGTSQSTAGVAECFLTVNRISYGLMRVMRVMMIVDDDS